MKTPISVQSRTEGQLLRAGLALPDIRAFVKVCAILEPLSPRARARVLTVVWDQHLEAVAAAKGPR